MFKMVDVCKGKMKLSEVEYEIRTIMSIYNPDRLIVDINLVKPLGYVTTFWISKRVFKNPKGRR